MRGGWGVGGGGGGGGGGIRGGMGWGGALAELGIGMLDWVVLAIRLVALTVLSGVYLNLVRAIYAALI